jgi:hypothetical protein
LITIFSSALPLGIDMKGFHILIREGEFFSEMVNLGRDKPIRYPPLIKQNFSPDIWTFLKF